MHAATTALVTRRRRPAPWDGAVTLDGLFARAAARRPTAVAVADGDRSITYEGAERRSARLATSILRSGVQLGDPVLVHCVDHVQALVAQLAVLKVGAVCVPVPADADPAVRERIAPVGAAGLVLCSGATRSHWRLPAVVLDDERTWARITPLRIDRSLPRSGPTDAAYLLVERDPVSPPTGHLIDHRAWLLALADRVRRAGRAERGVLCSQEPCSADTLTAMWWSIAAGGTLHGRQPVGGAAGLAAPRAVPGRIGSAVFTPHAYADVLAATVRRPVPGPGTVVVVGEPCPPALVARHFDVLPHTRLLTEFSPLDGALPWASFDHAAPGGGRPGTRPGAFVAGGAAPRVRITVRDDVGRALPTGSTGEIWASGAALPFDRLGSRGPGAAHGTPFAVSRYRGRWNEDGLLEVTGPRERSEAPILPELAGQ
ncbi:AMP-binding protein [Streptomyces sp. NPDC018584]|uniref:AMP-binding protein n=1 Tax=unclassified Streptomyces TaxID=2593676 RepID=UPI0037B08B91